MSIIAPNPPAPLASGLALHARLRRAGSGDAMLARCRALQRDPPGLHQQEYLLARVVADSSVTEAQGTLSPEPLVAIFPELPYGRRSALGCFTRLILGLGGFARVHAHHLTQPAVRPHLPALCATPAKWACLHCLVVHKALCLDSEWHMLLECPLHAAERAAYHTTEPVCGTAWFANILRSATVNSLVAHLHQVRWKPACFGRFCAFVGRCMRTRRLWFGALDPAVSLPCLEADRALLARAARCTVCSVTGCLHVH